MANKNIFSVWEGIFKSFEEAGEDFSAFDTDNWLTKQKAKVLKQLQSLREDPSYLPKTISKDYPLPLVIAMLLSQKDKISVLDFGGGMGSQYLELLDKIPEIKERVSFYIVESDATIRNKPTELEQFKNLTFFSSLDAVPSSCDIIHIGSTLPYIDKWQDLLKGINSTFHPTYFVFSDLLAGNIPTFITQQIYYDKRIPHRFYNFNEFSNYMHQALDFKLIYITKFIHKILDQEEVFPNFALPKTHQLDRAVNAIFYRS